MRMMRKLHLASTASKGDTKPVYLLSVGASVAYATVVVDFGSGKSAS